MVTSKKLFLRFFFSLEVLLFTFFYFFGSQGLYALFHLEKENRLLAQELEQLEQDVATLDKKLFEWEHNPFYKEKVAREQLHMAHTTDTVYFVD